jgi:hypothetical protein
VNAAGAGDNVEVAVDNDVVLKAVCYGLAQEFWPQATPGRLGVLGSARYVVSSCIERASLNKEKATVVVDMAEFLASSQVLEPSAEELALAVELELAAQLAALPLDGGESQLCAIVIVRELSALHSGDKRAIASLDALLATVAALGALEDKVICLEQIVLWAISERERFGQIAPAICAEPSVDKTLSICFSCFSEATAEHQAVQEALESYIAALRAKAPAVLSPTR